MPDDAHPDTSGARHVGGRAGHEQRFLRRDAEGGDFSLYLDEEMPPRTRPVQSSTVPFPASPKAGANDAHWGLGQVYEFYRDLGRNSIDGKGGTINAVVGVTDFGSGSTSFSSR